jgi:uncharacterized protein
MSQDNVELVRDLLEPFLATGEIVLGATAEDVVVYDHDIMDGQEYRGHEGVRRWVADWSSAWSSFTMVPEEYIDAGDCVVVLVRMRATGARSGVELDRQDGIVYRLRDGQAVQLDYYNNRRDALASAGLAES